MIIMYCPNCRTLFHESPRCPVCGSKKVRAPLPEDTCFLIETAPIPGAMLRDILEQNKIPVLSTSTIGAGMAMRAGSMFERIRYYVRYDDLDEASKIVHEFSHPAVVSEEVDTNE